jgi:hypothetical protein
VIGLELKAQVGRQSLAQRGVEVGFVAPGASYAICRSLDGIHRAMVWADVLVFAKPAIA